MPMKVAIAALGVLLACEAASAQIAMPIPEAWNGQWRALLHYRNHDGMRWSGVDDASFFLSIAGAHNPEREWAADRLAFLSSDQVVPSDQHAQCRFPARFALMRQALGWSDGDVPVVDCRDFEAYRERVSGRTLVAVFVSHYLGNPASASGHVMLYLSNRDNREATLADYSVSFEANTGGMSPGQYLPRGLLGKLEAGYRVEPLYVRVLKYERQEQRDLWLFPLRVEQGQIDQLVRHLWELKDLTFRYGFLEGNCAQKILEIMHAVMPEDRLLPYGGPAVLPQEVARRLVEQIGLAGEPIRRPSISAAYTAQVAVLNPEEKEQLRHMLGSRTVPTDASPAALSAALAWSEMEMPYHAFRRASDPEDDRDYLWRRELWTSRVASGDSAVGVLEYPTQTPGAGESLLSAHKPSMVGLGAGRLASDESVVEIRARWLLHDALDPPTGYPPLASVEVADLELEVNGSGHVRVDEATALRVEKLGPASDLESPLVWKVDVGARRLAIDHESPLSIGVEVSIGVGAALLRPTHLVALYSMIGTRPGFARRNGRTAFLAAGIWSSGLLIRLPGDVRARVSGEYALSLGSLGGGSAAFEARVRKGMMRDWDVELGLSNRPGRRGFTLAVVSFP